MKNTTAGNVTKRIVNSVFIAFGFAPTVVYLEETVVAVVAPSAARAVLLHARGGVVGEETVAAVVTPAAALLVLVDAAAEDGEHAAGSVAPLGLEADRRQLWTYICFLSHVLLEVFLLMSNDCQRIVVDVANARIFDVVFH